MILLLACRDDDTSIGGEKPGELLDTGDAPAPKDRDGDGTPDEEDGDADDPTVYPGAPSICGDDRLNDCDSDLATEAAACAPSAETPITQSEALVLTVSEDGIGGDVLHLGDLRGDGEPDLGFPTTDWAVEEGDADGGLLVVEQGSTGSSLRLSGVYSAAGVLFAGPLVDANGDGFGDLCLGGCG